MARLTAHEQLVFVETTVDEIMKNSQLLGRIVEQYQHRLLESIRLEVKNRLGEERHWHGEDTR